MTAPAEDNSDGAVLPPPGGSQAPASLQLGRLFHLGGLAALLLATYELARPTAESMFLSAHGAAALPWAWLGVAVGAALVSTAYARAVARYPLGVVIGAASSLSAALFVLLVFLRREGFPAAPFLTYVVKDLYIVVLLESLWAVANASWRLQHARWLYGLFPLFGSAGSLFGGQAAARLTERFGTENALLAVAPALIVFGWLARSLDAPTRVAGTDPVRLGAQLTRLARSRYLQLLAITIGLVQLVVAFVDAGFNARLESLGLTEDARTVAIAGVYQYTTWAAAGLQLLAGPLLAALGVTRILVGVPVLVMASLVGMATVGSWHVTAFAKVMGKALDYSLFRAAKELVYLPLEYAEKTEGKGLVDMLTYRVAKGAASALLLVLAAFGLSQATPWVAVGLGVLWTAAAIRLAAAYRSRVGDSP